MISDFTSKRTLFDYLKDNQHNKGKDVSMNTLRTYHYDIWDYLQYCTDYEKDQKVLGKPLPYSVEEGYIKQLSIDYSYFTLIKKIHATKFYLCITEQKDFFDEKHIKALLSKIRRNKDLHQKQAPTFTINQFKAAVDEFDERTLIGVRNTVLFLVGFVGAMRRSELLALRIKDITHHEKGLILAIGKSKTNQYGKPAYKMLFHVDDGKYCPVNWLVKLVKLLPDDPDQPLFTRVVKGNFTARQLSNGALDNLIKKAFGEEWSSHSFRATFISIARSKNLPDTAIMRQTLHKDSKTLDIYTRFNEVSEHNAAEHIGL